MTIATAASTQFQGSRIGAYRRAESSTQRSVRDCSEGRAQPNFIARRFLAGAVTLLTVATLAGAISGLLASFGGGPASASEVSSANIDVAPHVARSGDTMWSIASTYRGDVDHGRYVDALIRANGGVAIVVGQAVQLP